MGDEDSGRFASSGDDASEGSKFHSVKTRLIWVGFFVIAGALMTLAQGQFYAPLLLDSTKWVKYSAYESCWTNEDIEKSQQATCIQNLTSIRFGMAATIMFGVMALVTIGASDQSEGVQFMAQNKFHLPKLVLFLLMLGGSLLIPNGVVIIFGHIAQFVAAFFLVLVVLEVLKAGYDLNDSLVEKDSRAWDAVVLLIAGVEYVLAVFLLIWAAIYCTGRTQVVGLDECPKGRNWFFIAFALFSIVVFTACSVQTEAGALLPAAQVALYVAYLTWSSVSSDPRCDNQPWNSAINDASSESGLRSFWLNFALSFVLLAVSVAYTATRYSQSKDAFQLSQKDEDEPDDDAEGYSYGYFHLVFMCASCYLAMLYTGWEVNGAFISASQSSERVVNVWLRFAVSVVTSLVYLWSIFAEKVLGRWRDFD